MNCSSLSRVALSICVTAILLAACGGSQSATGTYGVVPQSIGETPAAHNRRIQPPPPAAKNLYVANIGSSKVTVYKPGTGSPTLTISQGIKRPLSLAFDATKKLYVANYQNQTISIYAIGSNVVLHTIKKEVGYPSAISFDASNSDLYDANFPLYSGSGYVGALAVYAAGGAYQATITKDIYTPQALTADSSGNVYVANWDHGITNGWVTVYSPSHNQFYKITDGVSFPAALTLDGSGNLYVLNNGPLFSGHPSVTEYAPGSTMLSRTITAGLSYPTAIVCDGSGNLYVANDGTSKGNVTIYGPSGVKVMRTITSGIDVPDSLAIGSSGYLNVANSGTGSKDLGSVTEYAPGGSTVKRKITTGISIPVFVTFGP